MNLPLLTAALVAGGTAFALVLLLRRLASPSRYHIVTADWLSRFSVATYRPMGRLLTEEDYSYLAAQKGYHPNISKRLRAERVQVFRAYLGCLRKDFSILEAAVRMYMAASRIDRPDVAKAVLRQRLVFTYAVLAVEARLVLFRFGLGAVDVRRLVGSLDGMRAHLGHLALARQASAA